VSDPRAGRTRAGEEILPDDEDAPAPTRRGRRGGNPSGLKGARRGPQRPPRPALVELATALLVVSGFLSLFLSLGAVSTLADSGELSPLLVLLALVLGVAIPVVGIGLRYGRWWLLGVNLTAVASFLELTSGSAEGLLFGGIDLFVVVVLLLHRPWFAWTPADEPGAAVDDTGPRQR
jgi:hypothetical protein